MKKILLRVTLLLSLLLISSTVYAVDFDETTLGNLSGTYKYSDVILKNVDVKLYKIASMNESARFEYLEDYSDFDKYVYDMSDSELESYASEIKSYIDKNKIVEDLNTRTDKDGNYSFSELETGLYLIVINDYKTTDYVYKSKELLISNPIYDSIDDEYIFDIELRNKVERIDIPKNLNTGDNIYLYITILGVAIILVIIVIFIRRKDVKNEKNKK